MHMILSIIPFMIVLLTNLLFMCDFHRYK